MKQQRVRRPSRGRVPVPPPTEIMRDRRQRRPGTRAQQIQTELEQLEDEINDALNWRSE